MPRIEKVNALEILDSRGNPTVRAFVTLGNGITASASVPSGATTGSHEAYELRDGGKRYGGKGVLKAVKNVNQAISKKIKGLSVFDQQKIDRTMIALDGTPNKRRLGANAMLSVSLACARAGALAAKLPLYRYLRSTYSLLPTPYSLPTPTMNVINGGGHADSGLAVQEFMIIPKHRSLSEHIRVGAEVFYALKEILKARGFSTAVGDEGGFAPALNTTTAALTTLVQAIKKAGYKPGEEVVLGMDIAASEFAARNPKTGAWVYAFEGKKLSTDQMIRTVASWLRKFPIESIEDPLAEDDWTGWQWLMARFAPSPQPSPTKGRGRSVDPLALPSPRGRERARGEGGPLIIGDDLFVTNKDRLQKGIALSAANAILIKLNQIGTLTETMETIALARRAGYAISVSHRSGETCDTFAADLAVAVSAERVKFGSLSRSERTEKYNRLIEIERELL